MKQKISVGLLIALVAFPQISETIYTPALPDVASGLNASAYLVEATLAIYFLGFALGVLLWGTISDFIGRRHAMLIGLALYGIGTLGCANAENVFILLAWRFLQAFGASVGSVITQTILRDAYSSEERTKLFSIISGALAFSPAIGPLLGGFISEFFGWRANFWSLAILAVILIAWTFYSLSETLPKNMTRVTKMDLYALISSMAGSLHVWGHVLLIAGTNGIIFGFYQEAPFIFIDGLGMQPMVFGFFGLLIAAATLFAARVTYRKSAFPKTLIQKGSVLVLLGSILFTCLVFTGIFESGHMGIGLAVATLFLIFFGIGLIIPNSLSIALKSYQTAGGTAGSLFGGVYYFLIAGCTFALSAFHNGSALPLPLYMTVLALIIAAGSRLIKTPVFALKQ